MASACQAEQDWHSVDPAAEKLPEPQSVHAEVPAEDILPWGQTKQTEAPSLGLYVPATQSFTALLPGRATNFPAGAIVQDAKELAAVAA